MGFMDFDSRYGKYFEPIPDVAMYLERIGLAGEEIPLSKAGLDKLQTAHLFSIPFENIDLWDYNKTVDYGIMDLWDKIILRKRGGYCFELNALYMALLQALGFDAYAVGARTVTNERRDVDPPYMHRMTVVTIGDKRYVTDVGFGFTNAARISICLDEYGEQDICGYMHTVEDMPDDVKLVIGHSEHRPPMIFKFTARPLPILDFIGPNYFMSAVGFRFKRIANLHTPDGGLSVDGAVFRETRNGEISETPAATAQQTYKILTERYGMILNEPLLEQAELKDPPPPF